MRVDLIEFSKMGLGQIIDKHPLVVLAVAATAVGSMVFGAVDFYRTQEVNRIRSEAESVNKQLAAELARIKRVLDSKEQLNLFDVFSDEVVQVGQIDCGIYIAELSLCGPELGGSWQYTVTSELELLNDTVDLKSDALSTEFKDALNEGNVHLIRHEMTHLIKDPTGQNPYRKVFAYIHIRNFPLTHMPKRLTLNPIPRKMLEQAGVVNSDMQAALNRFFADDPMVAVLSSHLWDVYTTTLEKKNVYATVVDTRKFRGGFRFASVLVFKDHIIDDVATAKFFVMIETFALTRPGDIVLVTTFVPMKTPSGQDSLYDTINGWVLRMRLLR